MAPDTNDADTDIASQATKQIPEPRGLPFLGNITTIDSEFPLGSLLSQADQLGEIYRMRFPGKTFVVASTQALVNELCDEKRFRKSINSTLKEVRHGVHDGLFTATHDEENWGIAHRVLMPAFGPLSIRELFPAMHDIASQLALKWARAGPDAMIPVTDDFTRLALDTLALCSMGYRFNSFYDSNMHPFIDAMAGFLQESGQRSRRVPLPQLFYRTSDAKFEADIKVMRETAKGVLDARRAESTDHKDLLGAMMRGRDPQTGRQMNDESIMDNLITFLIAGHETTSGLLSFAFYQLMRHPEAYQAAQREVDTVVGKGPIEVQHMSKLPYLEAVLRETLRLNAPISAFTVEAIEDTVLGGKYPVPKGEPIINLLAKSMQDPTVFGETAREFRPERMLDEPFNKVQKDFPNCWKPFGNGIRACIGRPFAWQEAVLSMAMLLQNFNFVLEPGYVFGLKQTLTIKPKNLHMRAVLREGDATTLQARLHGGKANKATTTTRDAAASGSAAGRPMTVLYGSNAGTCEALAQRIATDAPSHGFAARVDCLDSAKGQLPKDQPVVIVTASYEGQPPDNAGHFYAWLQDLEPGALAGVSYSVFGCGHRDWAQTFHKIPKLIDEKLAQVGADRVAARGLADVSTGDIFADFEGWEDSVLWPALQEKYGTVTPSADQLKVAISTPRASTLRQNVKEATVVDARALSASGDKRHIEIKLPEGMTYEAGDYLAVLAVNPANNVQRALRRFGLARDAHVAISGAGSTLPNGELPAFEVLSSYVELAQPATKRNILAMAKHTSNKAGLEELVANYDKIKTHRLSVLDVLERFPDVALPIGEFLAMLPPMRVRQYSISSSPLWNPSHVTLTFSVLEQPALSGQGVHHGVATSYLASLAPQDALSVSTRPSHAAFSLPADPMVPVIFIAAGSGIAPFRGFVQERAAMLTSGQRELAPALLFFGCHGPDDDLYREEMDEWEKQGAVEVLRAYSKASDATDGCRHVDDAMWKDRVRLRELWKQEAKVFVCGSSAVGSSVKTAMVKIREEAVKEAGVTAEEADTWFEGLRNIRYVTDVFD